MEVARFITRDERFNMELLESTTTSRGDPFDITGERDMQAVLPFFVPSSKVRGATDERGTA